MDRLPISAVFHERMVSCNNLGETGFNEWIFHPTMLFGSTSKWWGDRGKRDRAHEGLDFYRYRTLAGTVLNLTAGAQVPVLFDGRIAKVVNDFLGKSVFISHDGYREAGSRLYTIVGHITPGEGSSPGDEVRAGDAIGIIAGTEMKDGPTPHHLHVSVAWIPDTVDSRELGWNIMAESAGVVLLDPLRVIDCPYSIDSDAPS